jgi:membrane protein DedA with SNARE-associated domain
MFEAACAWLASAMLAVGYPGIFILMAIESSFVPVPSELVMPPAGYLISTGQMSWAWVILAGTFGSLFGSLVSYHLALWLGRPFFVHYGKYLLISERQIVACEQFFHRHGEITIFVARLIPVLRHLISLPAGLARMNRLRFSFYTTLGAGIWVTVLTIIGYVVGRNKELLKQHLHNATLWTLLAVVLLVGCYVVLHRHRQRRKAAVQAGQAAAASRQD